MDEYCKIEFSDNTTINMVGGHKFFNMGKETWEYINYENIEQCIGNKYAKVSDDGTVMPIVLTGYEMVEEIVTSYSYESMFHINLILGDMLTFTPQEYDGLFEYFAIRI